MIATGTLCLIIDKGNRLFPWQQHLIGKTCTVTGPRRHWFGFNEEMYPVDCPGDPGLKGAAEVILRPITPPPIKIDTREEMTA